VILCDTSGLLANYDRSDRQHAPVHRILAQPDRRILSPFVLAELDYLIARIAGQDAELLTLDDVARGVYEVAGFTTGDVASAKAVIERYPALELGLADASIVVLADRYQCYDVLTLDQRHFRTVSAPNGRPFRLLPTDAG
jgi:predicted nucleic acid-binding protein